MSPSSEAVFIAFACHNGHVPNGFAAVVVNDYLITIPLAVILKGFREGSESMEISSHNYHHF